MTRSGPFASRSGEKLAHALTAFGLDPTGLVCVDFGSHVGGFVDCLLARAAARVYAVEPGRGVLEERLRRDPRVVIVEGANALRHDGPERADLLTIDVGWTPQRLILPAARRNLRPGGDVVTLVKPHYEAPQSWLRGGVLPAPRLEAVIADVERDVVELGWSIRGRCDSPIPGHAGNRERLFWLRRAEIPG